MSKRLKIVFGSALSLVGLAFIVSEYSSKTSLNATGFGDVDLSTTHIMLWVGVVILVVGAGLFILAGSRN